MAKSATHVFRVSLKAKVYREIEIEGAKSLHDLAAAIIRAFDFDFDHAFGFYSKLTGPYHKSPEQYELFADMENTDSEAGSVERTKIAKAFPAAGKKMLFVFDYGDEWRFQVELRSLGEKLAKTRYPRILSAVGKAPPQYSSEDEDDE